MDEALAGHATFIEVELDADGYLTVTDNGRGIPVDPHPKFPEEVGARSHHVHAARGRQIRLQGLRDLRRPARRRRVGGQRPLRRCSRSRSRATRSSTDMTFERGMPKGKLEELGKVHNRRGTQHPLQAGPRDFRRQGAVSSRSACSRWRARRPTCSAASKSAGAATRNCCGHRGRAGGRHLPFPGRAEGLSRRRHPRRHAGASGHLLGQVRHAPARTAPANGRSPGPRTPTASCRPTPTPSRRRTAARTNPACARALLRGLKDHAERVGQGKRAAAITVRRRDGRRGRDAVGVRARAGISGPDQGSSGDRGSAEDRRAGHQGSVRSLARRQSAAGQQAAGIRGRALRRAFAPPRRKRKSRARPQ